MRGKQDAGDIMGDDEDPIVARARNEIARCGWSQTKLAERALLGEATIFRFFRGDYTNRTLRRIEQALGVNLEMDESGGALEEQIANVRHGGYHRQLYDYYEGEYICLRPAFADPERYMVYHMDIYWSQQGPGLMFRDKNPGYEQGGQILVPIGTPFVHFLTMSCGSARLMTMYHMARGQKVMRGLSLTISSQHRGTDLHPAATPILFHRLEDDRPQWRELTGLVRRDHEVLAELHRHFTEMGHDPMILFER
jgi:transcriptional regulator with XRE-family HTH domain